MGMHACEQMKNSHQKNHVAKVWSQMTKQERVKSNAPRETKIHGLMAFSRLVAKMTAICRQYLSSTKILESLTGNVLQFKNDVLGLMKHTINTNHVVKV